MAPVRSVAKDEGQGTVPQLQGSHSCLNVRSSQELRISGSELEASSHSWPFARKLSAFGSSQEIRISGREL